jgi:hypothetical protein
VPAWLAIPLAVILLDLAIYFQHVVFHAVPALWRLHRVHHADLDFDLTTGTRFHPIEILISAVLKLAVVAAIGAPPVAVLAFEVLLTRSSSPACAMSRCCEAGWSNGSATRRPRRRFSKSDRTPDEDTADTERPAVRHGTQL